MANYRSQSNHHRLHLPLQYFRILDLYYDYVAGLVGEGLSTSSRPQKKEVPWLGFQLQLSNCMGLLQKTNIFRDFRGDVDQQRCF